VLKGKVKIAGSSLPENSADNSLRVDSVATATGEMIDKGARHPAFIECRAMAAWLLVTGKPGKRVYLSIGKPCF